MPKIIVNEIDRTRAGIGEYTNFTVFVPGFCADNPEEEAEWDENGVCEFNGQEDQENFLKKVGQVGAVSEDIPAKNPKFTAFELDAEENPVYVKLGSAISEQEWYLEKYGRLFIKKGDETPTKPGHLAYLGEETEFNGKYEVVDYTKNKSEYANTNIYYIKDVADEGADGITANPQIGNQIAYELLGLGYTVLYKKITNAEAVTDDEGMANYKFWEPFEDKASYNFRYVVTGICDAPDPNERACYKQMEDCISELATKRGDCIALSDIPGAYYKNSIKVDAIKEYVNNLEADKYTALFMPYVTYDRKDKSGYNNNTFPAYFHYLVCASDAFVDYPEWFAVAGYTRGVSSVYTVGGTGAKMGESVVNLFEPRKNNQGINKAINIVEYIRSLEYSRGSYYIWGNRTAHALDEEGLVASHFLNIRQLCTTLKKELYRVCHRFTFDPNSDVLWINFTNAISPLLDRMKANQGIEDYKILKMPTEEKATLKAKVRIVPIEAVEDFEINLFLEDSIVGTNVEIDESAGAN